MALVVEPQSGSQLEDLLKGVDMAKTRGVPGQDYVGIFFDGNLAGEVITQPHIRTVPVKKELVMKLCTAIRRSRLQPGDAAGGIGPGDMYLALDSGKRGHALSPLHLCLAIHLHSVAGGGSDIGC